MFKVRAKSRIITNYGHKRSGDVFEVDRDWAFQHQALGVVEILEGDDQSPPLETKQIRPGGSGSLLQPGNPSTQTRSSSAGDSTHSQSQTPIASPPTLGPATPVTNDGGTTTTNPSELPDSPASSGLKTPAPPGPTGSDTSNAAGRRASAQKGGSGRAVK